MARTMNWPWLEAPDRGLAVGGDTDEAGVRLDIALVHRARGEGALDHDVGLLEAFGDVALLHFELAGDVRRLALILVELVAGSARPA